MSAINGNNRVKIEVASNDTGVFEAALERLFDPIYHIKSAKELRLAAVKIYVETREDFFCFMLCLTNEAEQLILDLKVKI